MYEIESVTTVFCALIVIAIIIGAHYTDLGKTPKQYMCFYTTSLLTAIVCICADQFENEYIYAVACVFASFSGVIWGICCSKKDKFVSKLLFVFPAIASIVCIYGMAVDEHETPMIAYAILTIVPVIYVIADSVLVVVRERYYSKKIESLRIICFSIPLIIGVLSLTEHYENTIFLTIGFTVTSVLSYLWIQVIRITTDRDTTLYNRYKLENYLEKRFDICKNDPEKQMCIGFGDMDSFGRVRREHGVDVARECIEKIGRGIRELSSPDFLPCIYGGDEFVFVTIGGKEKMEEYRNRIYDLIADIDKDYPFMLHMSIGFVELTDQETYDDMIAQADEVQAEVKERFYTENGITRYKWGKK